MKIGYVIYNPHKMDVALTGSNSTGFFRRVYVLKHNAEKTRKMKGLDECVVMPVSIHEE